MSKKKPIVDIRRDYSGYLEPYLSDIERLANEGQSPLEIARSLYAAGVRTDRSKHYPEDHYSHLPREQYTLMAGVVRHILREGTLDSLKHRLDQARKRVTQAEGELAKAKARVEELKRMVANNRGMPLEGPRKGTDASEASAGG